MIEYSHSSNSHSLDGARAACSALLRPMGLRSLLDVGCGTGTWLKAAMEMGIEDAFGVDGVPIAPEELLVPKERFRCLDLCRPWDLQRRFDAALCLEVAEHLDSAHAPALLDAIVRHTDVVLFSAACPGQLGQHHVNCQWPRYWQELFNARGFECSDAPRWLIWEVQEIEPWYRQNLLIARKRTHGNGPEARIPAVIHPEMLRREAFQNFPDCAAESERRIRAGSRSFGWYLSLLLGAWSGKLARGLGGTTGKAAPTRNQASQPPR